MSGARWWTQEDDRRLIRMINVKNRSRHAASVELCRSLSAIDRRYRTLVKNMDVDDIDELDKPLFDRVDTSETTDSPYVLWANAMGRMQ